jgi:hypothetical protein
LKRPVNRSQFDHCRQFDQYAALQHSRLACGASARASVKCKFYRASASVSVKCKNYHVWTNLGSSV